MERAPAVTWLAIAFFLVGCGDSSEPQWRRASSAARATHAGQAAEVEASSLSFGWSRPVTTKAFPAASTRLGAARSTVDGSSLHAIVADPGVRVRGDDKACATCHAWASSASRLDFCDRVPTFLELPTAKGDGHDEVSAKALVLKELLERWHSAGCPE